MLGHGEPIRVKAGERVLFHILNASASGIRSLALPQHVFNVVALDGFLVPRPSEVPVLWIAPAERISAIVEMRRAGVWVLGDINAENRRRGLGIVVEYAKANGEPIWGRPTIWLGLSALWEAGYRPRETRCNYRTDVRGAHRRTQRLR